MNCSELHKSLCLHIGRTSHLLAPACYLCENTDFIEGCTSVFFKGGKKETQLLFLEAPDAEGPLRKDSPNTTVIKILRTTALPSLG